MEGERRPASVHVNFRIPVAYKSILEEEASKRDMNLNAFVNHIFAKFILLIELLKILRVSSLGKSSLLES
jgi:hypothetical protein